MSALALHCPYGHDGERFLSVKMLPDKVICYYDHNVEMTIEGSYAPTKPYYWYADVVDGGYMCLGVRNCQFVPK